MGAMLPASALRAQGSAPPPQQEPAKAEAPQPHYASPTVAPQPCPACDEEKDRQRRGVALKFLPRNLWQDQRALITEPSRMSGRDWKLGLPLAMLATGLVASDTAVEGHVTKTPSTLSHANTFSNAGLGAFVGTSAAMYLWGSTAKNETLRETGFLSGEAAIDAYADSKAIQLIAGRDRPFTANGRGGFLNGGSSFPSDHSAVSWAIASVIAHEYPGPMTKLFSYGLAGAVSAARVEAHQHFLGDAVLGSALGWYIGRQVYRARSSQAEIDPRNWGRFLRDEHGDEDARISQMGSTYVPLGSWVYPALERLAAMGYLPKSTAMMRPLTRLRCARLLEDAEEVAHHDSLEPEAAELIDALTAELTYERRLIDGGSNRAAQVEDVYARVTGIGGTPLRDSFHFAQTLVDDEGRPYGEGGNFYGGVTTHAEAGALAFYLRGEYQYASSVAPYSAPVQQTIASYDGLPYGWAERAGSTSRLRPIEAYVAMNLNDWQFSFGSQSLWWGPDRSTSLVLSNNTEAIPMLRLARVQPLTLPPLLSWLGPIHFEGFIGREGGVHYVRLGTGFVLHGSPSEPLTPPPYIWGGTFSIKPTENLELSATHTAIFAGYGRPLNLKSFEHTFSLTGNGQAVDPGKRTTGFNFYYRVPGLRRWLSIYTEAYAYDNPLDRISFERYALDPGLYFPQLPGLHRMELRLEAVNTNLPGLQLPAYFYGNEHYPQGYTNNGQIFGSWVGRQGTGGVAKAAYWLSARNRVGVSYRRMVVDKAYLQGGSLQDLTGSVTWLLRPSVELNASAQVESWNFPLLASTAQSNVAATVELRFFPKQKMK
jgi:membrane-associated phospholipid phosphatase